jgi:protein SCO1/2
MKVLLARARWAAILAVALTALGSLLAGCGSSSGSAAKSSATTAELNDRVNGSTYQGVGLTPPQPRPQFTLKDTSGRTFKFGSATAGKPTLLFFGYTNCPDVCPQTLADITNALTTVPAKLKAETRVVFVTTDVKHDTAAVLKSYLGKFDVDLATKFIGLYGTQSEIDAAQVASHITLAEDGGQTHSAEVLLYGSDDYARVAFLQSTNESGQIAHDLQLVSGVK